MIQKVYNLKNIEEGGSLPHIQILDFSTNQMKIKYSIDSNFNQNIEMKINTKNKILYNRIQG